jgi:hypothetical protein
MTKGEMRRTCKPEGKRPSGKPSVDERTILLVNLMEIGHEIMDPIQLDYDRSRN